MMWQQRAVLAITAASAYWAGAELADPISSGAASILDRYVEVSGGKSAHARIRNRVTSIKLEIVGQGIAIRGTITSARPNLNYTVMESEVTGKVERGTDGNIVWSNSATTGPQLVKGAEREESLYQAQMDRLVEWRKFHVAAAEAGESEVDGRPCRKVELTPRNAKPLTMCFDKETGLPAGAEMKISTPMGGIPTSTFFSDYRDVDGVKVPFVMTTQLPGQNRITTIEKVTHNEDLPEHRFAPPAALAGGK